VAGFGWCGRGIAARARGMGADVIVVEVDPLRALEAVMEGYRVMPMRDAAKEGHIFVTATGNRGVINGDHFALMKDGATLANAGHFDVEIDIPALAAMAKERREARPNVQEFVLEDGRRIRLLAEGRLVKLGAAAGDAAHVMRSEETCALPIFNGDHFALMKDGATLANAGHFDVEIDIPALAAMAKERREARPNVQEFVLEDGRRIRLLAEGRLVNLGAAEGHPAQVM